MTDPRGQQVTVTLPPIGPGAGAAAAAGSIAACPVCWVAAAGLGGYYIGSMINDAYGQSIGDAIDEIASLAAAGNQADTQITADYGAAVSAERLKNCPPPDRCKWLEDNKGRYSAAAVKATQKAWGCRGSRYFSGGKPR